MTTRYWHFLADDGRLRYGDKEELVEVGKTYSAVGELVMCENGMHASERAIDALMYAPGAIVCLVELSGEILTDTDKVCARHRKVIAMADATKTLHLFACDVAEEALKKYNVTDPSMASWLIGLAQNDHLEGLLLSVLFPLEKRLEKRSKKK